MFHLPLPSLSISQKDLSQRGLASAGSQAKLKPPLPPLLVLAQLTQLLPMPFSMTSQTFLRSINTKINTAYTITTEVVSMVFPAFSKVFAQ